ncbi:MAG TPA: dipicolinate synthase subunit B [Ruminococcaceae bacterium]|nr:dipicolinate synthase subunit B [Oscillospiraceae bacterium]HCT17324.1 dipicolinate synthase subunit B [Oscillospiraceae bacterium]
MNKVVGFALCGSFCTFSDVIPQIEMLRKLNYDIVPIMSGIAYETDTRFGRAEEIRNRIETICKHEILHTIPEVEPIGPKKMLDVLVIAPCTGNTAAKLANGITDTSVTMAAKSHLRNGRPVVIAVSTNDGFAGAAKNIGSLLNYKNIYLVPFRQDDHEKKPRSLVADFSLIPEAVEAALKGEQLQPIAKDPK